MAYPHSEIEAKWQAYWQQHRTFRTPDDVDPNRPKFYVLDMFPYPSGDGLHVIRLPGHYGALSPIVHVVPLQLLAYHTAVARGTDVDKPRNLAKSVTVE